MTSYWIRYSGPIIGRIGMFFEWLDLHLADKIIASSEQTKRDIIDVLGNKSLNISVVHNGISFEKIQRIKPFKKKYDLVSVGRLIKGKRVDLLIEAMHALKHFKPDISAVVVGDGPEKERSMKHAKAAGVNIDFAGRVEFDDDVIRYIKSAKVAVHLSIQEGGSSIVLHEFNACGLPVIGLDHPLGIDKELLVNGVNGYRVREDIQDIVNHIKTCLKFHKTYRQNCIKMARMHDWGNVMRQYEKVIGDCCNHVWIYGSDGKMCKKCGELR
jgi:glycosyltransferase involved in cell wall biosynthesis